MKYSETFRAVANELKYKGFQPTNRSLLAFITAYNQDPHLGAFRHLGPNPNPLDAYKKLKANWNFVL